jgi:hypothetical protein
MIGLIRCVKFMWVMRLLVLGGLLLSSLIAVAACSTGALSKGKATAQLTPAEQEEQDPEFWRIWEERRGLGE